MRLGLTLAAVGLLLLLPKTELYLSKVQKAPATQELSTSGPVDHSIVDPVAKGSARSDTDSLFATKHEDDLQKAAHANL